VHWLVPSAIGWVPEDPGDELALALHGASDDGADLRTGLSAAGAFLGHVRRELAAARRHGQYVPLVFLRVGGARHAMSRFGRRPLEKLVEAAVHAVQRELRDGDVATVLGRSNLDIALLPRGAGPDGVQTLVERLRSRLANARASWLGAELPLDVDVRHAAVRAQEDLRALLDNLEASVDPAG
jgi:hypothetical protein